MPRYAFHVGELPTPHLPLTNVPVWPRKARRDLNEMLVVEHRDEVFARIEADLAAWGIQVQRAAGAEEATRLYYRRPMELVLIHTDLPDETGWLFACKLRFAWPAARIWAYTPRWTVRESALAEFIGVEEVIAYGGDLQRLAAELFERLVVASYSMPRRNSEVVPSRS